MIIYFKNGTSYQTFMCYLSEERITIKCKGERKRNPYYWKGVSLSEIDRIETEKEVFTCVSK